MSQGIPATELARDPAIDCLLGELALLYEEMDRQYNQAAGHYGFSCTGCEDNCCLTRFYHHTFLEHIFLHKGFDRLGRQVRANVGKRARHYAQALDRVENNGRSEGFRVMCPLNQDGWCLLYEYRPMICRLHGIPHELVPPGRPKVIFSQGCPCFDAECGHLAYFCFDRTPFYTRMSRLETELKQKLGISEKSKKTVAHMVIHDRVRIHEIS